MASNRSKSRPTRRTKPALTKAQDRAEWRKAYRRVKARGGLHPSRTPRIDPRITEALDKLQGAIVYMLSDTVGVPYTGGMSHNLAIAAKAATDIRGILMLGGES